MSLPRAEVPLESAPLHAAPGARGRLPSWRALVLIVGASVVLWAPIVLAVRSLLD
jgi:hypothetical protein